MNEGKAKLRMAWISLLSSIIIGIIAIFIDPEGQIHESVLWFTAQLLIFTATCLGLSMTIDKLRQTINNFKDTINISNQNQNNEDIK